VGTAQSLRWRPCAVEMRLRCKPINIVGEQHWVVQTVQLSAQPTYRMLPIGFECRGRAPEAPAIPERGRALGSYRCAPRPGAGLGKAERGSPARPRRCLQGRDPLPPKGYATVLSRIIERTWPASRTMRSSQPLNARVFTP
jgi:hypothetical protein